MNIQPKKSLGQNFLKSKVALSKMLEAGEVTETDIILEVGPGKGVLTEKLLTKAKKVIAVEKDDRLIPFLEQKFAPEIASDKLKILHGDILDFDPKKVIPRPGLSADLRPGLGIPSYKLIANIPYYITGQFLRKFLEGDYQPERIVVMVQKEIAQRIIANNPNKSGEKKESLLSASVKAYGTPKIIMKVDKENFSPSPKVDSAILLISAISKKFFTDNEISEKRFFEVLHAGFAHKRKVLLSNLRSTFPDIAWAERFSSAKIPEKARAETLTLTDWKNLLVG